MKREILDILMRRDHLRYEDALCAIEDCQEEIDGIIARGGSLEEIEDAVAYWLNLESDYLEAFLTP